jgi:hypothetical protein
VKASHLAEKQQKNSISRKKKKIKQNASSNLIKKKKTEKIQIPSQKGNHKGSSKLSHLHVLHKYHTLHNIPLSVSPCKSFQK